MKHAEAHYGDFMDVRTGLPFDKNPQRDNPPDERFLGTLREWKMIQPLWVTKSRGEGTFKLIDGRERVWGVQIEGIKDKSLYIVPVIWWWADELSMEEIAELQILANRARSDNPLTDVLAARRLIRAGVPVKEILRVTGLHHATLKAFDKYDKLLASWEEAWLWLGGIDTTMADQLVRCTEEEQLKLYKIYQAQGNRIALAVITDLIDARPKPAAVVKVDKKAIWQLQITDALEALKKDVVPAEWQFDPVLLTAFNTLALTVRATVSRAPVGLKAIQPVANEVPAKAVDITATFDMPTSPF